MANTSRLMALPLIDDHAHDGEVRIGVCLVAVESVAYLCPGLTDPDDETEMAVKDVGMVRVALPLAEVLARGEFYVLNPDDAPYLTDDDDGGSNDPAD